LFALGKLYTRLKEFKSAINAYEQLVGNYPEHSTSPEALYLSATLCEKIEDYLSAINNYNKVVDKYPEYLKAPSCLFRAAEIYEKILKDTTKAIEIYNQLIAKYPTDKLAKKAEKKLKKLEPK